MPLIVFLFTEETVAVDMLERDKYLRTIGSKPGDLRVVDRNNVYEDVIALVR